MFEAIGVWHQVTAISEWTGLSVGALIGLAVLVYLDPTTLKLAIAGAVLVVTAYVAEIHGNLTGLADGRAEIQTKWDKQKEADAAARAAEKQRQANEAAAQKSRDAATAADLNKQAKDALTKIQSAPAADDGPVPKVLSDSWARDRAARGLK